METWIVFAVLLIVQTAYGYRSDSEPPEKIKLTSEPRYYPTDHKSNHPHEHSPGPSRHDNSENHESTDKEEDAEPKYDFYKPHDVHSTYGPSEEDSKYIPHSESYSKYIIPKKNPSSFGKHAWEDQNEHNENVEKSEEIPRYGFKREYYRHPGHKNFGNEDEDLSQHHAKKNLEQKDSKEFHHEPNYRSHPKEDNGDNSHYEYDEKHHKPYPEQKEHHGKQLYPEHEEEHHGKHLYPEHKEHHGKHHYPEHRKEHSVGNRKHHYPEHREEPGFQQRNHDYPHHKENFRIPHRSHHYPEHRERHIHHKTRHHHPQIVENTSYHRTAHHPEYKQDHEDHHESHPPRYQHWSDKNAGSFAKHKTDKWIEELGKGKSHHVPSEPEGISKHKIFHGEPHIEEFIKDHKFDPHKSPVNGLPDEPPHKEKKYADDSIKSHPLLKRYPYVNKYHREHHIQPIVNYKPSFNFGGHRHGWIYRPKLDLYQELRKDLDIKMRLLKEHEQKLAELQKKHLEKYHALFEPHHAKMFLHHELPKPVIPNFEHKGHSHTEFLHHELPKPVIPNFEHKGHSHTEIHEEKHEHIIPPHKHHSGYSDYPKEEDYPSHKSNYPSHDEIPRLHYDAPHRKQDHRNDEPKHYDSHHHKDAYVP